ncbi:enoyl-CoA hydratase/carnithine racemase [Rubricella aquisinus]|uniref:Enoyl-CoA hydratase/carnithine racemase n=1 Tax=Rubricella aquisinus TaxID=2028108 RepID=A0A840WM27_9RHOB|nr:hypothetical protein [Rubricella aquisinus]MBB5516109.1 enoyl-CoA hydratase/carnithine racemase [Rubricella aquisinus]
MVRVLAMVGLVLGLAACTDTRLADASAAMAQPETALSVGQAAPAPILTHPPIAVGL